MNLANYYNRFDEAKNYDTVMIRDGYAGQGAEINELQAILASKIKNMGDVLFKEGDIIRDAQVISNHETGEIIAKEGLIYIEGAVRQVHAKEFTIPLISTVIVGVYLEKSIVTELEDPSLYNPAVGSEAEGEAGAARRKTELKWGWISDTDNDGQTGDFFPIHTLDSGILRIKDTPPQLDSTSRAIAKYDRDSAGGSYVVSGLHVTQEVDLKNGVQPYLVQEGRARVNGDAIELQTSRRLPYTTEADLLLIEGEMHASNGEAEQEIFTYRNPIAEIKEVRITLEKTATLTHGSFVGCSDSLPDNAVIGILEVKQGGIIYTQGTDYTFSQGKVNWSASGLEPATGSTYSVKYRFRAVVVPKNITETSFTVQNSALGSSVDVTYTAKMPRIDRLILTGEGTFDWVKGVASDNPLPPRVPENVLLLASVYQSWQSNRYTSCDTVKVVHMKDLMQYSERIDWLTEHIARQDLAQELNLREAGAKKGIFVDPFLSDDMRDQGLEQSAAIINKELVLPISSVNVEGLDSIDKDSTLPFTIKSGLEQLARTGSMLVNPYSAFDPLPADVKLTPSIDQWTEYQTNWSSSITNVINTGHYVPTFPGLTMTHESVSSTTQILGTSTQVLQNLRQIDVNFEIKGFGDGEELASVVFDGITVIAQA